MLIDDLFKEILIEPAQVSSVNRLQIVSGFATPNMAICHMEQLADLNKDISIELIVGMTTGFGIDRGYHLGFQQIAQEQQPHIPFKCSYVALGNPVHVKSYCWLSDDKPVKAFLGSANYTINAFRRSQIEAMETTDAHLAAVFYREQLENTIDCLNDDIEANITFNATRPAIEKTYQTEILSLLESRLRKGNIQKQTHQKAGLNWGQRGNRDRNEAYIPIPLNIRTKEFFPPRKEPFTVCTDDGESFIMVVAQDGDKALETQQSNALLGRYFRNRMKLEPGTYITREHLLSYGRTNVAFTKLDEETFFMDFSPN